MSRYDYEPAYLQARAALEATERLSALLAELDSPYLQGVLSVAKSALVDVWRTLQIPVAQARDAERAAERQGPAAPGRPVHREQEP